MGAELNMARRIQLRRDTAAAWTAANPVLAQGEIGLDLTNNKIKIGNGSTAWNSLAYFDDKEPGAFDGSYSSLTGKPTLFSGSYNDLTNKLNLTVQQDLDGGAASTVYDDDTTLDGGGA